MNELSIKLIVRTDFWWLMILNKSLNFNNLSIDIYKRTWKNLISTKVIIRLLDGNCDFIGLKFYEYSMVSLYESGFYVQEAPTKMCKVLK